MAGNEGVLEPAVSGVGNGPARASQVTGSGLDAGSELWGAANCPPGLTVH